MLFLITIVSSLLVIVLTWALAIPFYFIGLAISISPQLFLVLAGLYVIITFAMFVLGAAIITTFNITVWTNLFAEIEKQPGESKISQVLNKLKNI